LAQLAYSGFLGYSGIVFGGMAIIAFIDKLIPEYENPHEVMLVEDA